MNDSNSARAFRSLADMLLLTGIDLDAVEDPDGACRMVYVNIGDLIFCIRPASDDSGELRLDFREVDSNASNTLFLSESQRAQLKESQEALSPQDRAKFIMNMLNRELGQPGPEETGKES